MTNKSLCVHLSNAFHVKQSMKTSRLMMPLAVNIAYIFRIVVANETMNWDGRTDVRSYLALAESLRLNAMRTFNWSITVWLKRTEKHEKAIKLCVTSSCVWSVFASAYEMCETICLFECFLVRRPKDEHLFGIIQTSIQMLIFHSQVFSFLVLVTIVLQQHLRTSTLASDITATLTLALIVVFIVTTSRYFRPSIFTF